MQITSLNISGFKYFDIDTQINFKENRSHLLTGRDSDQKYYIFEAILGVLFGLASEEKINFRDLDGTTHTFTGMLTLDLSDRTMLIERDFETDFVACLLSSKKEVKPFYQGKDIIQNGTPRPYMKMLSDFFSVTDKDTILEICYDADANDPKNLFGLLSTFYILVSPQFKISESAKLIENKEFDNSLLVPLDTIKSTEDQIEFLKKKKSFLTDLLIIDSRTKEFNHDLEKLQELIHLIQNKSKHNEAVLSDLKRRFPDIYNENAFQLRADILLWKSLREKKIEKEIELENTTARIKQVNRLIETDYATYKRVPETFESDFDRFGQLKTELREKRKIIDEFKNKLRIAEKKLKRKQQKRWLLLFTIPALTLLFSLLLFGPFWILIIPETIIVILAVLLYFGHINETIRAEIFHFNEDKRLVEIRMQEIESEIKHIFFNNPLFKDEEYLIIHLDRFKKYSKYHTELYGLKQKQAALYEELQSEPLTKQILKLEDKYSDKVNIDRFDVEDYLDRFVEAQRELKHQPQEDENYPGVDAISAIKRKYLVALNNLKTYREKAAEFLKVEIEKTELEIGNLSRQIHDLESVGEGQQFDPAKIGDIL